MKKRDQLTARQQSTFIIAPFGIQLSQCPTVDELKALRHLSALKELTLLRELPLSYGSIYYLNNITSLKVRFNTVVLIPRMNHLKHLEILENPNEKSQFTDIRVGTICKLKNLESFVVRFPNPRLPPEYFEKLSVLSKLTELEISTDSSNDWEKAKSISTFSQLTKLNIQCSKNINMIITSVGSLSNLTYLNASQCNISSVNLKFLQLFKLTKLDLSKNNIGGDGMKVIALLTNLKYLNLQDCNITNDCITHLTSLTKLVHLNVGDNYIGNEGLFLISSLRNLTYLSVERGTGRRFNERQVDIANQGMEINHQGIAHLTNLHNLRHLDFSGKPICDKGIEFIGKLNSIEILNVSRCNCSGDIESLQKSPHLINLNIVGNPIGDKGAEILSRMTLEELNARNCGISYDGVKLIGNSKIKTAFLQNNPGMRKNNDDITKFKNIVSKKDHSWE
ncbi:predicted protein [Naegleria gruberi]|uniref:Predicted protein n=1 Tax=Naegleria gruberi TaxID=5762 RepID=D2V438_NAEGR|nr:uncharacterized protein NAEGRDRAFT_63585 [Naegleria gruberi]EFC48455.1 predicted protein [Naegleria gruberi]|eukprot:XP_002681199.1 predicted protein [Naegleria gruberi strain NEG-M]